MKDTPDGVGGSEGIAAPPGPWAVVVTSIMAKPAWAAMEGMAMGIPCCMTAEPGGEEPPGGKKTWLMAPEDMHGLAFAIQRAVCRLYRGAQVHKDMPKVSSQVPTHTLSRGSQVPPFPVSAPTRLASGGEGKSYPPSACCCCCCCFFPPSAEPLLLLPARLGRLTRLIAEAWQAWAARPSVS